jgi:hypothetical protein
VIRDSPTARGPSAILAERSQSCLSIIRYVSAKAYFVLPWSSKKLNPSPPLAADEPLLAEARGQDTIVISETPEKIKAVGMVFYHRKSQVEILDRYLKVTAF